MKANIAATAIVIATVLSWLGSANSVAHAGVVLDEAGKLTLYSDFRLRLESDWDSQQPDGTHRSDRTRLRTRVRAELRYKPRAALELAARARTGSQDSQQSPHITLYDFTSEEKGDRQIVLDKWYGKVQRSSFQAWLPCADGPPDQYRPHLSQGGWATTGHGPA